MLTGESVVFVIIDFQEKLATVMSNREQSNKILAVVVIGGLGLCCVWVGVGWIYDLVVPYV